MNGSEMVELLKEHKGEVYRLGAIAPKNDVNWAGPWDCAEFASWGIYQGIGKLFGCADNNGDPASADAWTNWFKRDLDAGLLVPISLDEAKRVIGAFVLRYTAGSRIGHIAVTAGLGGTIEAASAKLGVCELKIDGRRWDAAFMVPGLLGYLQEAEAVDGVTVPSPYAGPAAVVLRLTDPMMRHPMVSIIGQELKKLGLYTKKVDDIYGEGMFKAVCELQKATGLIVDGEVVLKDDGEVIRALNLKVAR